MSHDLYSDFLLEHARAPQNKMTLTHSTCSVHVVNEGCADSLELFLNVHNGVITQACFNGSLCALSTAASSLFTEYIKGMKWEDVILIVPGSVYDLLGVTIVPSRARCALLCYEALQRAIPICLLSKKS